MVLGAGGWGCDSGSNEEATTINRLLHHTERGFRNTDADYQQHSFGDFLRWVLVERRQSNDSDPTLHYPVRPVPDGAQRLTEALNEPFTVTWIGHSTLLVRLDGVTVLTDPIWSDRSSPLTWLGPRRHTPPGIPIGELPEIDVVLLSHNHYDHLDLRAIRELGDEPLYLVPLGLGRILERNGVTRYRELDWWETSTIGEVTVTCLPAQHFSSRTPFDRNRALWCSWALKSSEKRFYFGGDTGYFSGFRDIGERCGPFDVAALPIGAYLPEWFMGPMHLGPGEALKAAVDVGARLMIPVHWGAFDLADDPYDYSPAVLARIIDERTEETPAVVFLMPGETRIIKPEEEYRDTVTEE